MKYYFWEFNPYEIKSNQTDGFIGPYDPNSPNGIYNYPRTDMEQDLDVPPGIKIRYHGTVTDFLNVTPAALFLVVSNKLLNLLLQFRMPPYRVFPTTAHKKEKVYFYNYLIFRKYYVGALDYKTTLFGIIDGSYTPGIFTPISVANETEYERISKETVNPYYLSARDFKLIDHSDYDLFKLPGGFHPGGYIATEQLVDAIRQADITGVRFRPVENPYGMVWR